MKRIAAVMTGLMLVLVGFSISAAEYVYTALDRPGSGFTLAFDINNEGTIVGYCDASGHHAFTLSGGTYTIVGDYGTLAYGINDNGTIVGDRSVDGHWGNAFALSGGTYTPVTYPGAAYTEAWGINDEGTIVGNYGSADHLEYHGFTLSGGAYSSLDCPGQQSFTIATGINDAGTIVGQCGFYGFILTEGVYKLITHPDASGTTMLNGINNRGTIVGNYIDWNGVAHGFSLNEGIYTPVTYPGAMGINDEGTIVGYYIDANNGHHGFVAMPPVVIDIRPGSYPNDINLQGKGTVPVAILSTGYFDASKVDPTTVEFADAAPIKWKMLDVDKNGRKDMVLYFNTQDLNLNINSTEAKLTAKTNGGINIAGTDSVNIVRKGK